MRLIFGSLGGLVLLATLASGCGSKEDGSEVNGKGSGNGDGNGTGANGGLMIGDDDGVGIDTGVVVDPTTACAKGTASATLSGVNMIVMFDRSSSMNDPVGRRQAGNTRWSLTSNALKGFFASPDAAGLSLALRFFPHDKPADGCNQTGCSAAACAQPLVKLGTLTADAAPTDMHEKALVDATNASSPGMAGQGTPIYAALAGALDWAKAQRKQTPNENSVVVLVTDGEANGCTEDIGAIAKLSKDAFDSDGIRTYAIGLTGSQESDMDQIAQAGGTDQGIFVSDGDNTEQDLLNALGAIRGQVLDCDFPVPEAKAGTEVNLSEINVNFTSSAGTTSTLGQVGSADKCTGTAGWYYDNPAVPTRIVLCPSACSAVTADSMAKLDILLGCATVKGTPK